MHVCSFECGGVLGWGIFFFFWGFWFLCFWKGVEGFLVGWFLYWKLFSEGGEVVFGGRGMGYSLCTM